MQNYVGTALLITCGAIACGTLALQGPANAAESAVPEPFRGFDNDSKYSISYEDLSELLLTVVVDQGISTRDIADPVRDITGTRLKVKYNRLTVNEANRFFYETFTDSDAGRQYLRKIQQDLQALPEKVPLEKFSRNEQLAYWLNLYNVTVLNEIISVYPRRSLKGMIVGRNSMFSEKLLTVSGVPLSLNDIQFTILAENYDNDPLIIYGLYQGIVGGPDIRPLAYNGDDVYRALEDNAFRFINSNRGTFTRGEGAFRVSSFYDRSKPYFPDFSTDLSAHLLSYLEGREREELQVAAEIAPDIDDWTITDLGGTIPEIGGSLANNAAALLDSFRSDYKNVYGGQLTATVEAKWPERDQDDDRGENREDSDRVGSLASGSAPVEGADVEEVLLEDSE